MKVDFLKEKSSFLLTNNSGQSMEISVMEFWEICRVGRELNVSGEVVEYLSQLDEINGVNASDIESNKDMLDKIVDKVIDIRIGHENGDQVYDAICECVPREPTKTTEATYADWKEFNLSKEECDSFVVQMVAEIEGQGVQQGSGYHNLKSFELYGNQYNLYCEVFKDNDSGRDYYGLYYALEYDEGSDLWSGWAHTETLDTDELKKIVFDIASADYTKDVQMHIDVDDLNISEDIRDILKSNRLTTLANIVNIGKEGLKLIPGLDELGYSEVALALGQLGVDLPDGYEKTEEIVKSIDKDKIIPGSKVVVGLVDEDLCETVWVNPNITEEEKENRKNLFVCVDVVYDNNPIHSVEVFTELYHNPESRFNALTLANAISEEFGIPVKNLIENEKSLEKVIADAQDRAGDENYTGVGKETPEIDM